MSEEPNPGQIFLETLQVDRPVEGDEVVQRAPKTQLFFQCFSHGWRTMDF